MLWRRLHFAAGRACAHDNDGFGCRNFFKKARRTADSDQGLNSLNSARGGEIAIKTVANKKLYRCPVASGLAWAFW